MGSLDRAGNGRVEVCEDFFVDKSVGGAMPLFEALCFFFLSFAALLHANIEG